MTKQRWWSGWYFLAAIVLLSALPLLWPWTPPLVDVPGHIARYRVELDLNNSPSLQRFFEFKWALIGNLGVDLLIIPAAHVFGLELGLKLLVLLIPALSAIGLLWTAREVHGSVPPTAVFAVPFAYGYPFNFGFINFALSMAVALIAFALWLRLSRSPNLRLRSVIFVPISCVIWLVHAFGWGALGLLAWSSELVRLRERGNRLPQALVGASIACIPLTIPIALMIIWRSGAVAGSTEGYFRPLLKVWALLAALRDRWLLWDTLSVGVAIVLVGSALLDKHLEFSRRLTIPAITLAIIFLLLPERLFGSEYADMRLIPFVLMIAILGIRPRANADSNLESRLAMLGSLFFLLRIAGNTLSFAIADSDERSELTVLDHIPAGARVLSLIGDPCGARWGMARYSHFGSFVITRKFGFSNDQWQLPGAQLLHVSYPPATPFQADASEVTINPKCISRLRARYGFKGSGLNLGIRTADGALDQFPRSAFDYVWLIKPEGFTQRDRADLQPVWSGRDAILFRVVHGGSPPATTKV